MKRTGPPLPRKVFRPKIDWWISSFLFLVMALATVLVAQGVLARPGVSTGIAIGVVLVVDIFLIQVLFRSRYEVGPEGLRTWLGPLRWTFPPQRIAGVRQGDWRHLFFGPGRLRLAFSTDTLVVDLREGWLREVVISPQEKEEFLDALRGVAPDASIPSL